MESATSAEIWQHFEPATDGICSVVPVVCAWVGGSLLTDKIDPDNIDLIYWGEDVLVDQVTDPKDRYILQMFGTNQVRPETGLRVDTRAFSGSLHVTGPGITSRSQLIASTKSGTSKHISTVGRRAPLHPGSVLCSEFE